MRKRRRNIAIGLCIGAVLLLVLIICLVKNRDVTYTCEKLPVYNGKLSWGMNADEVVSIIGEADTRKEETEGLSLIYEGAIPCEFGEASALTLYFGRDNLKAADGQSVSGGLCNMAITIDRATKEEVLKLLEDFYGTLSASGGSTQMELSLKKAEPNYFNEYHFCDEWKIQNLPDEKYAELSEVYEESTGAPVNKDAELMGINISGIATGEVYSCNIQLDAFIWTCLLENR